MNLIINYKTVKNIELSKNYVMIKKILIYEFFYPGDFAFLHCLLLSVTFPCLPPLYPNPDNILQTNICILLNGHCSEGYMQLFVDHFDNNMLPAKNANSHLLYPVHIIFPREKLRFYTSNFPKNYKSCPPAT